MLAKMERRTAGIVASCLVVACSTREALATLAHSMRCQTSLHSFELHDGSPGKLKSSQALNLSKFNDAVSVAAAQAQTEGPHQDKQTTLAMP